MKKAIFCIAKSRSHAHVICKDLLKIGFQQSEISILAVSARECHHPLGLEKHTKALACAATGTLVGGFLGGAYGLLSGIGILASTRMSPMHEIGPLYATLSCACIGGTLGYLLGSLIGLNMHEYVVRCYESAMENSKPLISIHVENPYDEKKAIEILEKDGAEDIASEPEEGCH